MPNLEELDYRNMVIEFIEHEIKLYNDYVESHNKDVYFNSINFETDYTTMVEVNYRGNWCRFEKVSKDLLECFKYVIEIIRDDKEYVEWIESYEYV